MASSGDDEENASMASSEENNATKSPILKLATSEVCKSKSKSQVREHFDKNNDDSRGNFDQEVHRKWLARMIISNELPFVFVEDEGFHGFRRVMEPRFIVPSRKTIERDCYVIYEEEMANMLEKNFDKLSSSISLSIDTWTSIQNLAYLCLTAHFIDNDWKLDKKTIAFFPTSGHSGEIIGMTVVRCLLNCEFDRVFSITVDNASSNDELFRYLKNRLNIWEGTVLRGEYLHTRSAVHILNLVVKDSLTELHEAVGRIRNAIKYVKSSPSRLQKFNNCVEKEKIDCKSQLCLDVETQWNSTYLMLEAALKFKKAFDLLGITDSKYTMELIMKSGPPTCDDWGCIRSFLPFLEVFYDTTLRLSGSLHITSNEYMKYIFGLGLMVDSKVDNNDAHSRAMAVKMKKKFWKYWENIDNLNILLFIAVVLDPRCKLEYVNFMIENNYDATSATKLKDKVKSVLDSLFQSYGTFQSSSSRNSSGEQEMDSSYLDLFFKKRKLCDNGGDPKSELDKYLNDNLETTSSSFDILNWWKINARRYPTLALVARDVLAIPVSTGSSESAFSNGGRVLDPFLSTLTPRLVEAFVCAQNWLRCSSQPVHLEKILEPIESQSTQ